MATMASVEKPIIDVFGLVYPKAKDGPAGDFLKDGSDSNLGKCVAMVEMAVLKRQGRNPYRADLVDRMEATDFFAEVSDNELDATHYLLGLVASIRRGVTKPVLVANKVDGAAVVKFEEVVGAGEKVEAKSEEASRL